MKKYAALIIMGLIMAFALTACGGGSAKEVTMTPKDLAEKLAAETVTSDTLAPIATDILVSTYFVDPEKIDDSAAYLGSGTTSCEAAVIKCKDSAYASEVEELFKARVKNQSELYASYNAAEVKKLDAAVIKVSGSYVALSISDDAGKAEELLEDAGF